MPSKRNACWSRPASCCRPEHPHLLLLVEFPAGCPGRRLQGITGGVLGSGIVAITLGLVGHAELSGQLGQNQRFAAAGGVAVTLTMAVVAYSEASWAMLVPIALAASALLALSQIRAHEIDFERASGAEDPNVDRPRRASRRAALLQNRRLLIFAACAVLFQVANAPMLPLVRRTGPHSGCVRSLAYAPCYQALEWPSSLA